MLGNQFESLVLVCKDLNLVLNNNSIVIKKHGMRSTLCGYVKVHPFDLFYDY